MAKYEVVKEFKDAYTKKTYHVGDVIELTKQRAKEIDDNLAAFGGGYIHQVKSSAPKEKSTEEVKKQTVQKDEQPKKVSKKK
ncbi:hypothetical protein ACO0KD_05835 [Enterococcus avium]|uniref:hypothetical protein n=1 Tax=Enterococcus avium TaxID=33945 RepID=UPI003BF5C559